MKIKLIVTLSLLIFILSCTKDRMPTLIELDQQLIQNIEGASPDGTTEFYILPEFGDLSSLPQDPRNPLTEVKVELGEMLFYETAIAIDAKRESGMGTYSCASCHIPEAGFKPGNFQGIADGGIGFGVNGENRLKSREYEENELDVQSARPLSLVNVAFVQNTFWNGQFGGAHANAGTEAVWDLAPDTELNHLGFEAIETQNLEGLKTHRLNVNKDLLDQLGYTSMFDQAFPDVPLEERYTRDIAAFAISAYIRSIVSDRAPFQHWLKGDKSAMTYDDKKGAILFFGKAQCYQCHYNKNLGSLEFHALGVKDMYQQPSYNSSASDKRNLGRGGFTGREEDNYKFKVPGLYNAGDSEFFFHGASKRTLEEVIDYFNLAEMENPNVPEEQKSTKFKPLRLTEEEQSHLLHFLENGLRDPDLKRYKPEVILSGNCFPNNDDQSRLDLGCN